MSMLFEVSAADVAETSDDWYTPRWVFDAAGLVFDVDVAAPIAPEFRTCPARSYLTVLDDGLTAPWDGLVWMNPPYSNPAPWVDRFIAHPGGLALMQFIKRSNWRSVLLARSDAITILNVIFANSRGQRYDSPMPILLAARGTECVSALARVAAADKYARGTYHVRPGDGVRS